MDEKNYKSAGEVDQRVPDISGIYCLRIREPDDMPTPFNEYLVERDHNIIYIGIALQSLN